MRRSILALLLVMMGLMLAVMDSPLSAAPKSYYGRVSLFGQGASSTYDQGGSTFFSELALTLTFRSLETTADGLEYGLDVRGAGYPSSEGRSQRLSVYDAFAGARLGHGAVVFRLGQMWVNDLGGLGSIAGGLFEFRLPSATPFGKFRAGVFGGYEPKILELGYASGVKKFGGYLALDGANARRHVLAYVNLRNSNLTEREVVILTNYIPIGTTFFLYQSAEYDLRGPAGTGTGNLTYMFANGRFSPVSFLEFQGTFHRGRSFDTRTISEDRLNNRPIDPRTLEGFLFESIGGRVTLRVPGGYNIYAGYSQDKTNLEDARSDRWSFGFFASNLFKTGFELNVSDWRMKSEAGSSYDSWYVSLGRSLSQSFYLEAFYSSSVSVFRLMGSGNFRIDSYPRSQRFGASSVWNVLRTASVLLTAERTTGGSFSEFRFLAGISYRF